MKSQEIEATVSANYDKISQDSRDEIAGFAEELKSYVNSTKWIESEWQGPKLAMTFGITFVNVSGNLYKAKLLIGSQRNIGNNSSSPILKILDDEQKNSPDDGWSFYYRRGQQLRNEPTSYDDITSLIDYYVYIALGFDFDSYSIFGGDAMFAKAYSIANLATTRGLDGWSSNIKSSRYSRYGLIKELTDIRFQPIRSFVYNYHYNGLDLLLKDKAKSLETISNLFSDLVRTIDKLVEPTVLIRVLNDTKFQEYSSIFKGYSQDPLLWKKLKYIDPGHTQFYEEAETSR
ncbi:MAG: DUF4835 family protein [Chlorobiota bacterium]|nr:MAG: DUF4835 family protein [Chlorobiota bacterium]